MLTIRLCLVVAALLLAGCETPNGPAPEVARSSYFVTKGAGFRVQFDPQQNLASVRYELLLQLNAQHASPLYLRTLFENPNDSSRPYVVDTVLEAGARHVELVSPEVPGLESGKTYKVVTGVFNSPARNRELGFHVQNIRYIKPRKA